GLVLAAHAGAVPAEGAAPQGPAPRYTAAMLAETSFDLRVRATIRTQSGGPAREETIARDARLEVRVTADGDTLRLEAWFDSLAVFREGPEGRITPDADGLIGGRFRGTLTPDGHYRSIARPFVPDELAEVTDLGGALHDLLPLLPATALAIGGRWDAGTLRIVRRPDSTSQGIRLERYRWSRVAADTTTAFHDDSLRYETRTRHEEEGDLVWHPVHGPLVWHRVSRIAIEIPAEGPVRRAVRTSVAEDAWVWRRLRVPPPHP
ncbi:MAG: hypothetical protein M3N43_04420, partial [Actinomycetota bacterium]|nr:hypothetical protein [Actinomycetota bacterium]